MMRKDKIEQFHKEFFHKNANSTHVPMRTLASGNANSTHVAMRIVLIETDGTYELYDKFFGEWLRTEM